MAHTQKIYALIKDKRTKSGYKVEQSFKNKEANSEEGQRTFAELWSLKNSVAMFAKWSTGKTYFIKGKMPADLKEYLASSK
tara:strand:- start:46 stop:288 length:243 start_codon:yes stop_codon:yes gene_type:complete